jgi:hypothetical protein
MLDRVVERLPRPSYRPSALGRPSCLERPGTAVVRKLRSVGQVPRPTLCWQPLDLDRPVTHPAINVQAERDVRELWD